jgi:Putative redox-active protein (C_GCAxxG_C_C)
MTPNMTREIQLDDQFFEILTLKQSGFCCSQIIVKLVLRQLGRDNPDLVRAMAGLCYGAGAPDGTCGVLTAAACALSLGLGDSELPAASLPSLLSELADWFKAKAEESYGGTSCGEILEASPDKRGCADLVAATSAKLRSLLAAVAMKGKDPHHA